MSFVAAPTSGAQELVRGIAEQQDAVAAARLFRTSPLPLQDRVEAALAEASARMRSDPRGAHRLARLVVASHPPKAAWFRAARTAGGAAMLLGRPRLALAHYDYARHGAPALDAAGDGADIAAFEAKRIHPLVILGRHDDAQRAAAAALRIRCSRGDSFGIAEIETALGDLSFSRDRYREALRLYGRARDRLAEGRYGRLRAILDCNSANCLESLQRYGAASRLFQRARERFEAEGFRQAVAHVDHNLAYFHFLRGRYSDSLRGYERAETVFSEVGDTRQLAQIALERAEVLLRLGMVRDAHNQAAHAAEQFGRAGLVKERAQALVVGAVARMTEDAGGAADDLRTARAVFRAGGSEAWMAECDLLLASVAASRGQRRAARRIIARAQRVFSAIGLLARAGSAELSLARLSLAENEPHRALDGIVRAADLLRGAAGPWLEVEILRLRGLARIAAGDAVRGTEDLEGAILALESHRGAVPADEFMVAFLAAHASLYEETFGAQLEAGREKDAFATSERARARALSDLLAARGDNAAAPRALADVRVGREREELSALYARLHRHATGADACAPERVRDLRAETSRREAHLARTLRRTGAGAASASTQPTLVLERLQSALDADTTVVQYFAHRGALHAFVVGRDVFEHRDLHVDDEWVASRAQRLGFHLAKCEAAPAARTREVDLLAARANLGEAGDAVFGPVRDLVGTRRIVVVPHGSLHGLPFHAFPEGDGWLADTLDFTYAPSASVHVRCGARRPTACGVPAVFALPDEAAPLIAREARVVETALGGACRTFHGADATLDRLREAARESRILHLATHGMFREGEPTMSCLRLADTWLNLHDVYDLDVRGELVVLSACEGGAAAVTAGGDPMGLLRGFLIAGAPRVLASRWRVADRAAALFMATFYSSLAAGAGAGTALRRARTDVRRRHPHPYHWAAFSLFGHPGGCRETPPSSRTGARVRAAVASSEPGSLACARRP